MNGGPVHLPKQPPSTDRVIASGYIVNLVYACMYK